MDSSHIMFNEIPLSSNIKYEYEEGKLFYDRDLPQFLNYPANYGFIPNTLADDGDAIDCVLYYDRPILPLTRIRVRVVGVMLMEDEKGMDHKLVTVHENNETVKDISDISQSFKDNCMYFFSHYKDLETDKWSKVMGWKNAQVANGILAESYERVSTV